VPNELDAVKVEFEPRFPKDYSPGIGILGCGGIVKGAHLPAYNKHKLRVVGVYDIKSEATVGVTEKFGVEQVFGSVDELLSHPDIQVVDIGTHPAQRVELIQKSLAAGKHVLAQKPLALDVGAARECVQEAKRKGLKLAVNQNGRWAPAWRIATVLVQKGMVGDVGGVTHLYDFNFGWTVGQWPDDIHHFAIYDYSVHWIDITRCWMEKRQIQGVRAHEWRVASQPAASKQPWGFTAEFSYAGGAQALIRGAAHAETKRPGHPFWIHGTQGTIRGNVLGTEDFVELERDGVACKYVLKGAWFPDGFAGTMGELLCSIAEKREPYNAAAHNLLSLQMTLTACKSAEQDGKEIEIKE
jgi:predicted dehydrogenase